MPKELAHPAPVADEETKAYWEGAGRGELVLQRCGDCGEVQHRPRAMCVACFSDTIEHFVASGRGEVFTFTITRQNQVPGFREACPYVLAYVELEEGPRLLTNVVGCSPEDVRIGLRVRVDFAESERGLGVPRFCPA